MSPASFARPLRRGFTLIELMVSTALMVVIVLVVVSIAADTFKAYDRAVADLSTQSEARAVLDALENDFQTAVIRPDGRCWMEVVLPGSSTTGGPASAPTTTGNLNPAEHPILMLFAAPQDRPRWNPSATSAATARVPLKGDVCAIAYRIGQRSPFSTPGAQNQQVYGVYRTIIDSEMTFKEALPIILSSTAAVPKSPWDYWSTTTPGSRTYGDYNKQTYVPAGTPLINTVVSATTNMPWTLDDHNFLASNVVAMNLVFWCTSSLPQSTAVTTPPVPLTDPLKRPALMLRPILPVNKGDAYDQGAKFSSGTGYRAAYTTGTSSASTADAPIHFATPATATTQGTSTTMLFTPHPYEEFSGRLRIFADRIYPDALASTVAPTTTQLPYLPYSLRAIEVSVTVLTPEGAKELATLQSGGAASSNGTKVLPNEFKRIVVQQGRAYTRYIRLLSNGG
jgi:prepilin-type N-terminal cleavage/methylation domain-containing protein